jgi:hypothetical protein
MKTKLELVKMPNEPVCRKHPSGMTSCGMARVYFITINDVIVERLFEEASDNRYEFDTQVQTRIAVYEDALKVKARKTRGV